MFSDKIIALLLKFLIFFVTPNKKKKQMIFPGYIAEQKIAEASSQDLGITASLILIYL